MDRYKMSTAELCEDFCQGTEKYDKWLYYSMLAFCQEWKQREFSEKEIKRQVDVWVDDRHNR